jgi:hypothetical protein
MRKKEVSPAEIESATFRCQYTITARRDNQLHHREIGTCCDWNLPNFVYIDLSTQLGNHALQTRGHSNTYSFLHKLHFSCSREARRWIRKSNALRTACRGQSTEAKAHEITESHRFRSVQHPRRCRLPSDGRRLTDAVHLAYRGVRL